MRILVDADSCPRAARDLVARAAQRLGIVAVFAANRSLPGITGDHIVMEICPATDGAADDRLAELAGPGDLAICRDLPLAKRLLGKGAAVIDDRGRAFSADNIDELISIRDFAVGLAENGLGVERTAGYGRRESKAFADALDRQLRRLTAGKRDG